MQIDFFVEGNPVSQPRQRHFAKILKGGKVFSGNYCPENGVKSWKERIFWKAKEQMKNLGIMSPIEKPFSACFEFYFERPKAHDKKALKLVLLPKTSKPDIDNLIKAVFDAMNGVLIKDDNLAYSITGTKFLQIPGEKTGIMIRLSVNNENLNITQSQKPTGKEKEQTTYQDKGFLR